MADSKTSRRRIGRSQRATQALNLRLAGNTFKVIGREMRITEQRAHAIVTTELARLNARRAEAAEAVTRLELERLDALLAAVWPKAMQGHVLAVDRALSISARRAKLLGLDSPDRHELTGQDGQPVALHNTEPLSAESQSAVAFNLLAALLSRLGPETGRRLLEQVAERVGLTAPATTDGPMIGRDPPAEPDPPPRPPQRNGHARPPSLFPDEPPPRFAMPEAGGEPLF